jgi:hypothetical protein
MGLIAGQLTGVGGQPTPTWVNGAEVTAPGAGVQLAKVTPANGRLGVVYGFRVVSQEANAAGKVWRLRMNVGGTAVILADLDVLNPTFMSDYPIKVLHGNGVDFFEVVNVVAGTALTVHQVSVLYGEVQL